jgi:hypothetical protein
MEVFNPLLPQASPESIGHKVHIPVPVCPERCTLRARQSVLFPELDVENSHGHTNLVLESTLVPSANIVTASKTASVLTFP